MSDFKQIIDNVSNIENLDNTTILKILEKFDKELSKYAEKQSGLSDIINVDFIPIENGLTYADGEVDILGTLKFTIEDNVVVEKPANIKLNIKGDSYIVVDSDETGNSLVIREDDELYHKVESISNPNLLINGDFRVNQRDETSYSGSNKYTVDRWKTNALNSFVSYNTNSKKWTFGIDGVTSAGPRRCVVYTMEDYESLKGKQVTVSIDVDTLTQDVDRSVTLHLHDGVNDSYTYLTGSGIFALTKTISENATKLEVFISGSGSAMNYSITPNYIKLEIGGVATANSPRPYAEELAMCQRYNVDLIRNTSGYPYVAIGFARNETQLFVVLNLPQAMRVRPTTFVYGGLYLNGSNKVNEQITSSNISFGGMATNGNQISLTITTTGLIAGQCYALQLRDDGHIGIDAEIY